MKGHIFQMFEGFVKRRWGGALLDELYISAQIPEDSLPFLRPVSYPDQYLLRMISSLASKTGVSIDSLVYEYGKYLVPDLIQMYPVVTSGMTSAIELLQAVDRIHVSEVKKLYPDASPPDIRVSEWNESKREGVLTYNSPRHLCRLVEGVLDGIADWYKEKITYQKTHCLKKGDPYCVYLFSIQKRR